MSTPSTENAPVAASQRRRTPPGLVLGEIVITTHDSTRAICWTLGTRAVTRGLTLAGIAAAASATAQYLAELNPRAVQGSPRVHVSPDMWAIPFVHGHQAAVTALMTKVVNAEGSIGALPS
jgi:uncharacterized membrane protein